MLARASQSPEISSFSQLENLLKDREFPLTLRVRVDGDGLFRATIYPDRADIMSRATQHVGVAARLSSAVTAAFEAHRADRDMVRR